MQLSAADYGRSQLNTCNEILAALDLLHSPIDELTNDYDPLLASNISQIRPYGPWLTGSNVVLKGYDNIASLRQAKTIFNTILAFQSEGLVNTRKHIEHCHRTIDRLSELSQGNGVMLLQTNERS